MQQWSTANLLLIVFAALSVILFGIQYWWTRKHHAPQRLWIVWLMALPILLYTIYQAQRAGRIETARVQMITGDFARLYAAEFEAMGHWKVPNDVATNDPLYLTLIEKEKTWENINSSVSDIYTLRKRADGTNIFIVDSETDYNGNGKYDEEREQRTPVGEVYDKYDEGLEKAFRGEANFDPVPITDRWGTWISSFIPLHNPLGHVEAVLGVDFDAHHFMTSILSAQLRVIGLGAAGLLVLLGYSTMMVVLRNQIAEREIAEQRLRLLGASVEQSSDSIIITDADLNSPGPRIVFVNPAFTRITGYSREEVAGKSPRILQGPGTDVTTRKRLKETLSRGESFTGEVINYRKDGTEYFIETEITPIRNAAGKVTHFVSVQRDITTRKKLEEQLFQSQKMETVAKLAGGVAHEFNNIMTSVLGHTDLILADSEKQSAVAESALVIRKAAERAAGLTRQLLAYARRQFLRPEKISLNLIVAGMEDMVRHLMDSKVEVRIVTAPDLYEVFADSGQIEQVITNLVFNARDAMPDGGRLTIKTENFTLAESGVAGLPELPPGDYVKLSVTDTGKGMTRQVKARVFEPFFSTKDIGKGSGLGLATCHGIIKQSGGDIRVESEPGAGSTFTIYLPRFKAEAAGAARGQTKGGFPRGTETVLVVEDSPELLEMASILLRHQGYKVFTAANGLEAVEILRDQDKKLDLLFTDLVMPKMDGWELSRRAEALRPGLKILFCSAYTENAAVRHEIVHTGTAVLHKPFTLATLATRVRAVLDGTASNVNAPRS